MEIMCWSRVSERYFRSHDTRRVVLNLTKRCSFLLQILFQLFKGFEALSNVKKRHLYQVIIIIYNFITIIYMLGGKLIEMKSYITCAGYTETRNSLVDAYDITLMKNYYRLHAVYSSAGMFGGEGGERIRPCPPSPQ